MRVGRQNLYGLVAPVARGAAVGLFFAAPMLRAGDGSTQTAWYLAGAAESLGLGPLGVGLRVAGCAAMALAIFGVVAGIRSRRRGFRGYRPFWGEAALDQWTGVLLVAFCLVIARVSGVIGSDHLMIGTPVWGFWASLVAAVIALVLGTTIRLRYKVVSTV